MIFNKLKLIFFCFFLLSSCRESAESDFLESLAYNLYEVSKINFIHPSASDGTVVDRPPGAWIVLMEVGFPSFKGELRRCLGLKVPRDGHEGALKLIEVESEQNCRSSDFVSSSGTLSLLEGITEFSFQQRGYSELEISYNYQLESVRERFSFLNVQWKESREAYSDSFLESLLHGSLIAKGFQFKELPSKELITLMSRDFDDSESFCFKLDEDCTTEKLNSCDRCRFGYYPVVTDLYCPQKMFYVCGPNQCGQRGQPACFTGSRQLLEELHENNTACFEESRAGFCRQGLSTSCTNGVLTCL